jgi:hypothetical protein
VKAKRGIFEVERIVKTKTQGWVIDEADLKEFFEFSELLLLSPVIPLHEFAATLVLRVVVFLVALRAAGLSIAAVYSEERRALAVLLEHQELGLGQKARDRGLPTENEKP